MMGTWYTNAERRVLVEAVGPNGVDHLADLVLLGYLPVTDVDPKDRDAVEQAAIKKLRERR